MTDIELAALALLTHPDDPADALTEAQARAALATAALDGVEYATAGELAGAAREHWWRGDVEDEDERGE